MNKSKFNKIAVSTVVTFGVIFLLFLMSTVVSIAKADSAHPMLLAVATTTPVGFNPTPTDVSPNVALNKTVVSPSVSCNANETPDKAVNENISYADNWCTKSPTKWIRIDLGQNYSINQIVLFNAGVLGNEPAYYNTRDFFFAGSVDGVHSTIIKSVKGWTDNTWVQNFSSPSMPIARYILLNVTQGAQPGQANIARIYDVVVRGVPAP